jgi:hypothetical protein
MNWEAISAIGEAFGGLAILITLVYLAQQLRQNTRSQSIATYESAMSGFNDILAFMASDLESISIWRRGCTEPRSLNEDEAGLFDAMVRAYCNHLYKLFRLYEKGVLPESEWVNVVSEAKQLFQMRGLADFKLSNNYFFADLWTDMDARELKPMSTISGLTELSDDA